MKGLKNERKTVAIHSRAINGTEMYFHPVADMYTRTTWGIITFVPACSVDVKKEMICHSLVFGLMHKGTRALMRCMNIVLFVFALVGHF